MNTVICVTGPDNVGKTVLVNKLKKLYPKAISHHFGAIKTKLEGKKLMLDTLETFINHDKKFYIFDRCFLGDFVYGPLFRKYDAWDYFDKIYEKLRKVNNIRFLFIFMYADENTYEKFGLKKKEDEKVNYQKREWSERISVAFIKLANKLHGLSNVMRLVVNCNNYDSLDDRNEYVIKHVKAFVKKELYKMTSVVDYYQTIFNNNQTGIDFQEETFGDCRNKCKSYEKCSIGKQHREFSAYGVKYDMPTTFYGNITNPKYVFVGEAPGHRGCGTYGIPFYGDTSGYVLYRAFQELNIIPSSVYLTNTIKCCPKDNNLDKYYNTDERLKLECVQDLDREILSVRGDAKVIALGNVAYNTLKALKVPDVVKIFHPAYYLRIGNTRKFIDELKNVI